MLLPQERRAPPARVGEPCKLIRVLLSESASDEMVVEQTTLRMLATGRRRCNEGATCRFGKGAGHALLYEAPFNERKKSPVAAGARAGQNARFWHWWRKISSEEFGTLLDDDSALCLSLVSREKQNYSLSSSSSASGKTSASSASQARQAVDLPWLADRATTLHDPELFFGLFLLFSCASSASQARRRHQRRHRIRCLLCLDASCCYNSLITRAQQKIDYAEQRARA